MPAVLEVKKLVKRYPNASANAVDGIDFTISEGVCFGLLGPNGAGKTTTLEIMEGIQAPTSGRVFFRGEPVGERFRERMGIQFQETSLQDNLTVRETLKLFSKLYEKPADLDELARLCALSEFLDRDHEKLSGGQRQRVLLALALVNDPDVLFLDEPTTGLDPQARRNFWDLVRSIKQRRKTIVLTTHYMEEAYVLCDEIAIVDHGRILAQGAPDHLLKQHFEGVSIEIPKEDFPQAAREGCGKLFDKNGVMELQTDKVNETLERLMKSGVSLSRMKVRSQTLEDLFLELTGRGLKE